jgi:hypothetical protein
MRIYKIENQPMPWGDYGDLLLKGLLHQEDNQLKIKRTGPYIPPIIVCGINTLITTNNFKELIESSHLHGYSFTPIEISKLVNIDWLSWDLNSDDPKFYPESGEPEDYIESGLNDEKLRQELNKLWVMNILPKIDVELVQGSEWWINIPKIKQDTWKGNFGITDKIKSIFVDETGKDWLEKNSDNKLNFIEVEVI